MVSLNIFWLLAFEGRFDKNVMSLAEIFKNQPLLGRKFGKFSVAIEFELLHVMTAFCRSDKVLDF